MKRIGFLAGLLGALILTGCGDDEGSYTDTSTPAPYADPSLDPNAAPVTADGTAVATTEPQAAPQPKPVTTSQPKPWAPTPAPTQTAPAAPKYPKAEKIPGKPGRVKSPYAPYAQEVDVSDLPSGSLARCPYTGKVFVVP
jgi:hypothetical protein